MNNRFKIYVQKAFLIPLLLLTFSAMGVWENKTYKPGIKTIQAHPISDSMAFPVIQLDSPDRVIIAFDDLTREQSTYYYRIFHCTWDWETSDMIESDYLEGFNTNELYTYEYSFNTNQDYIHYELTLPNNDLRIKRSGNYIVQIFENNDPNALVLTRRIMVYEPETIIQAKVKTTSVVADRETQQEIDFNVSTGRLKLYNVYEEIHAVILQNQRWDNAKMSLKPKFLKGNQLIYDFEKVNNFNGGNEYRNFDIKNLEYQSDRIAVINNDSALTRIFIHPDEKRTFNHYSTWEDLDGGFLVKQDYAYDSNIEADYVWVYFTLPFEFPLQNSNLYIAGLFTDYSYTDEFKMVYDFEVRAFKKKILLKQGYYNYVYMRVDDESQVGQIDYIEGNHYEANNNYHILIYYHDGFDYYDRLVGMTYIETHL